MLDALLIMIQAVAWRICRSRRKNWRISPFSQTTNSGAALNIEEYVPLIIPTISVAMKWRIVTPPNNNSAESVNSNVREVLIDRSRV